ncbi:hypothetical protein NX722_02225 [Endozoicomonas gorgoniicola]|uniref:Uncharacterized protein n=1 Tax=Endozoicomonas gorgoniicola TaxID=1234144 RepID=A0ABT3MQ37_9GAMM|nr:hypothetical protein [Endozoicomonas gorgoniicola]MCW7551476.1 hypothetical protein [Endozoicomonas gorgoniicola]
MIKKQQSIPRICAVICLLLISVFSWNVFAEENKNSRAKHFYKVVDNKTQSWFVFYLDNYALVDLRPLSNDVFSVSEISQNEAANVDQPVHRISVKEVSQWPGATSRIAAKERIVFLFYQLDTINYLNRSTIYRQHFNTDFQRKNSRMISILLSASDVTITRLSADSLLSVIEESMGNLVDERKLSSWSFQGVSANEHTEVYLRMRVTAISGTDVNEIQQYLTDNLKTQADSDSVEQSSDGMNDMLRDWVAEQQREAASASGFRQAPLEVIQEEADSEFSGSEFAGLEFEGLEFAGLKFAVLKFAGSEFAESESESAEPEFAEPEFAEPEFTESESLVNSNEESATALDNGQQSNAPLQDVLTENQLTVISNSPVEDENMQFDRRFRLSLFFFFRFAGYDNPERRIPHADVVERIRLFAEGIKRRHSSSHFTVTLSHVHQTRKGIAVYYHFTQRLFSSRTHLDRINHVTLTRNIQRNRNLWGADAASPLYVAESLPAMPPAVIEQRASWLSRLAETIVCRRLCGRYRQSESLNDIDFELKPKVQQMILETAL